MIRIIKTNLEARCEKWDFEDELDAIKKFLTFKVPNYFFARAYKMGVWDGTYTFFNGFNKTFATGLLDMFPEEIRRGLEIVDTRMKPIFTEGSFNIQGVTLRDYQLEAVIEAVERGRCIVTAPTNAGKTEMAAAIMKMVPVRTLWLTHRGNLLEQTRERLALRLGEEVGTYDKEMKHLKRVTVGMVQSIHSHLRRKETAAAVKRWLWSDIDMLIVDECHHQSAGTWFAIAKACNAYYRYGLSATPLLSDSIDNSKLIAMTGSEVKTVTNTHLIEEGISARPTIHRVQNTCFYGIRTSGWWEAYSRGIENNEDRNQTIAEIVSKHILAKEPVLVLCNTVKHADNLMSLLAGKEVLFVSGETEFSDRNKALHDLEEGTLGALVATPIFDEGADAPNIRVLVLAGGGASPTQLLQRLGRGMRKKQEGENKVHVYDFFDLGDRYLAKHSRERFAVYKKEGFEVVNTTREEITK